MLFKVMQTIMSVFLILFVIGISTVRHIVSEKETIRTTSVGNKHYYSHYKKQMKFTNEDGQSVTGYFETNHTILDNLKHAVIDFDKTLPDIVNLNFNGDFGSMGFGFYRKDITFTLYTRQLLAGMVVENVSVLPSQFDPNKKTKFITHGWLSSGTSPICQIIKNEFLNKHDVNVFIVDWSPIADIFMYPIPAAGTRVVAIYYADFVNDLINKVGVKLEDLHLIGHSLGAHVSGFTGRRITKGKVSRITGLDPALPFFDVEPDDHLNVNDSVFVDVIHTCAGFLGIKEPIGHVDFYPNGGGPPQPGCDNDWELLESCSHSKSYLLFADSLILDDPYIATTRKRQGGKDDCHIIPMGYSTPAHARGVFFLNTH